MVHQKHLSSLWLPGWQQKPKADLRVFCFPYAGAGASLFRSLSEQAPACIEICPVQLPGRENRFAEAPFFSLEVLVATLSHIMLPYLERPYVFFGHSMGALISFELACALRRKGHTPGPERLYISGHRAPHLPQPQPLLHRLADPQLIEALRSLHGTPEEILNNTELLRLLLPLLRADLAMCETYHYQPEPPLSSPISAFGGLQDQSVPRESLLAWREHTSSSFQVRFFPGDHFFFHTEQEALLTTFLDDMW